MKAVAVQTLFIIIFIGMTIFFTFLALSGWLGLQVPQLTSLGCAAKRLDYCSALCKNGNLPNWDSKNCGDAPSIDDCKKSPGGFC